MSYFLPHLPSGWHVDEAIKSEEDRVVVIRFGHDWDAQCMTMDETLYSVAEKVQNFAVIYLVDITCSAGFQQVQMYELYDPCTVMFFYRNKHIMIDLGTGNNNKINWAMDNKQELIDIIETVYRGASKGRGLVVSPKACLIHSPLSSMMSVSPAPSSQTHFASSVAASTVASSPPPSEDPAVADSELDTRQQFRDRFARLERLLEKSFTYSNLLGAQMDKEKRTSALRAAMHVAPAPSNPGMGTRKRPTRKAPKRRLPEEAEEESLPGKPLTVESVSSVQGGVRPKFLQPSLVTGGKLKDYQLEGVEWLVSLDKNGVSGILADEMGLGKTLQVIAFNAHLREQGHFRPFLIVCPLSVIHNWIDEFHRFAPDIPVCMYHGPPADRAECRRTVMREPDDGSESVATPSERIMVSRGKAQKGKGKNTKTLRSSHVKRRKVDLDDDEASDGEEDEEDHGRIPATRYTCSPSKTTLPRQTKETFPVVVTTYEMIIRDQPHLSKYNWGYIVVDEGHRLKNLNCRLIQEIKKYPSAGRMILTGTPLHNNLAELWSLLHFILPDIFDDLNTFQEWYVDTVPSRFRFPVWTHVNVRFNLGTLQSRLSPTQSTQLISTLHGILKPFLLRRLKADVEGLLPPKKEYVIYAPLSVKQRNLYDEIVEGRIRRFLIGKGIEEPKAGKEVVDVNAPRKLRGGKRRRYDVDGNDEEYFERMEMGEMRDETKKTVEDVSEVGRQFQMRETVKGVNNMRLQNTVMQLRKACSHPLLFRDPTEPLPETTEELVDASGKMMLLERLLDELFRTRHKVLLFSQFTTMLDIIETWATELKGWQICRIDGSTSPMDRRDQMDRFQKGGQRANAPVLFLLSTRAGGLGITLTAADTVIFYDQDWNPQMDLQAQDRAHRIGQTKPVLVFRLVTAHTIETRIMQRATEKRQLEALVIAKGKFKMPGQAGRTKTDNIADMAAALLKLEGDHIEVVPETRAGKEDVLSDRDLEMLLDRSEAVFTDRRKGWSSEGGKDGPGTGEDGPGQVGVKKAAFAVYEAPVHAGNELVAKIMGEDVAE
ncbi:SNF2 family DNA-dependent ATPase [Butyriboletus roseoflavus]|nr:SNF2 family DNA-dependent ATPase [Butyriboletus roseoflavus]